MPLLDAGVITDMPPSTAPMNSARYYGHQRSYHIALFDRQIRAAAMMLDITFLDDAGIYSCLQTINKRRLADASVSDCAISTLRRVIAPA